MSMPRENLYRMLLPGCTVRATDEGRTLTGHFSVFNQWTEINSVREGHFLERVAPGAFSKTFQEQRDNIKVLFQHGRDPQIGDKPLGPIRDLREDDMGAYYEVDMLDTDYNRELIPGLEAGLYGASFRFSAVREDVERSPERSEINPRGIPERTIREARVPEFGPVTFPAYAGASAGVRCLTDIIEDVDAVTRATPILLDDERLSHARAFIAREIPVTLGELEVSSPDEESAPPQDSAEPAKAHPVVGRRVGISYGMPRNEQRPDWKLPNR